MALGSAPTALALRVALTIFCHYPQTQSPTTTRKAHLKSVIVNE